MRDPVRTDWRDLETTALRVRETAIRMATDGGCFLGASLSAVDIIVYLYRRFLKIDSFDDPARDYFFLSKGHDVPALYGTFVELGFMPRERLNNHLSTRDAIYWHPSRKVPGVEFHSGSLGHGLPVALGVALELKMAGRNNRVVVLLGDGELNEGSNWEALLVAQAYQLDNLIVVIDRNYFQANVRTEELIPLEPLLPKFAAFGAGHRRIDGHSFAALDRAFSELPYTPYGPSVVVADTKRGKGVPSIEERADRWFCNFTREETEELVRELRGGASAHLDSETLMVR